MTPRRSDDLSRSDEDVFHDKNSSERFGRRFFIVTNRLGMNFSNTDVEQGKIENGQRFQFLRCKIIILIK